MGKSDAETVRGRGRGPGKSHPDDGDRRHGWDFAKALALARKRISAAGRVGVPTYTDSAKNPVERARRTAEAAAPALIDLTQALTLGTNPEELDRNRGGLRIMSELALRQLSIVGLKSGELVEHEPSERFRSIINAWFGRDEERRPDDQRQDDALRRGHTLG
jgi:hypothetical protein